MIRIFFGYFLIVFSGILFLSILSFSPYDSAFFTSNFEKIPQNIAGKLGVTIASFFITLYGKFSSYLFSFAFFSIGINCLTNKKIGKIMLKTLLFLIAGISLSIALSSIAKNPDFLKTGLFGIIISNLLTELLPKEFAFFIFTLLFIISLLSSMKLFRAITTMIGKAMVFIFVFPFGILLSTKKNREEKSVSKSEDKNLDFLFSQPQTPHLEEKKDNLKEPEFLKKNESVENFQSGEKLEDITPKWLIDDNEKEKIISYIRNQFQLNSLKTDNEKLPEIVEEEQKAIEEENSISNVAEESEKIFEDKEVTLPVEEIEEISGEADYRDEIIHREKSAEDVPLYIKEKKKRDYVFPSVEELEKNFSSISREEELDEIRRISELIETTLASFKIDVKVNGYSRGPSITRYEIIPPEGLKLRSIINLTDDLALKLGTKNIRIVAPIGNKSIIGIEVPNKHRRTVVLRDIIESEEFKNSKAILPLILGMDIAGNIIVEDLTEMPHLLIAGTTGSGKSVFVNSLIAGLVFTRTSEEVKFIFIDPKMVELELYDGIPHLLSPVITNPEEAIAVLEWLSEEMDKRYQLLSEMGVRNIIDYNNQIIKENLEIEPLPFIVVIIDEFANLMLRLPKETEKIISRLAAMARATGIHLVVATQRPSVDVVTGIIKANFPSRIAFRVSSQTDSRTILDKSGAERLLGKGDFLFMTPSFTDLIRIQAPFVSIRDVESIVKALIKNGRAEYVIDPFQLTQKETEEVSSTGYTDYGEDPLFYDCLKEAVMNGEVSASFLQRKFRIGYNRASRIIDAMDRMKILGPYRGAGKPREVLIGMEELNKIINNN
jgi:S-DNA-T family DNA segregation ATPase FtsK/SpoIIIE